MWLWATVLESLVHLKAQNLPYNISIAKNKFLKFPSGLNSTFVWLCQLSQGNAYSTFLFSSGIK